MAKVYGEYDKTITLGKGSLKKTIKTDFKSTRPFLCFKDEKVVETQSPHGWLLLIKTDSGHSPGGRGCVMLPKEFIDRFTIHALGRGWHTVGCTWQDALISTELEDFTFFVIMTNKEVKKVICNKWGYFVSIVNIKDIPHGMYTPI